MKKSFQRYIFLFSDFFSLEIFQLMDVPTRSDVLAVACEFHNMLHWSMFLCRNSMIGSFFRASNKTSHDRYQNMHEFHFWIVQVFQLGTICKRLYSHCQDRIAKNRWKCWTILQHSLYNPWFFIWYGPLTWFPKIFEVWRRGKWESLNSKESCNFFLFLGREF